MAKENGRSLRYCLPAIAMGKAVGTSEIKLWDTMTGCCDGRKNTLTQDINFSSLSWQDLSSFAMPFLDGDVESTDKNASRKVGYFQSFTYAAVVESFGGKHNLLGLKSLGFKSFLSYH